MRLLKLGWRPPHYVDARYAARPEALTWSYEKQRAWIFSDLWGTSNAWETYLPPFGYQATDLITDCPQLDIAWWREFGSGAQPAADAILAAQIRAADPEILVIESIERHTAARLEMLKGFCPNLKLVILSTGTEIDYDALLPSGDLFLARIPHLVPQLRAKGYSAELFRHAFDRRVLEHIGEPGKSIDISFIGSIDFGFHVRRRAVLTAVAAAVPLTVFSPNLYSLPKAAQLFLRDAAASLVAPLLPKAEFGGALGAAMRAIRRRRGAPVLQYVPVLRRHPAPAVFGLQMYRTLAASLLTLNVQPEIGMGSATNMRLYEATGAGACLLTDAADDLAELFVPDEEVVDYRSTEELISKLKDLVRDRNLAIAIGERAKRRVLRDHTYEARFAVLDQIIRKRLADGSRKRS